MFDIEKFKWVNGQHLKKLAPEELLKECEAKIEAANPFHQQSREWKLNAVNLFKEYVHFAHEIGAKIEKIFSADLIQDEKVAEIKSWPTTLQIRDYLQIKVEELENTGAQFANAADVTAWGEQIKNDLKIKGKPLFMGMRAPLTYEDHGPDLKILVPLIPLTTLHRRLEKF
jgi:glutamyl/glutaminyl-tRNA synthetase